ncbi:MAG: hypothetical protein ACOYJ2_09735 [Rickettsiales bacterium]
MFKGPHPQIGGRSGAVEHDKLTYGRYVGWALDEICEKTRMVPKQAMRHFLKQAGLLDILRLEDVEAIVADKALPSPQLRAVFNEFISVAANKHPGEIQDVYEDGMRVQEHYGGKLIGLAPKDFAVCLGNWALLTFNSKEDFVNAVAEKRDRSFARNSCFRWEHGNGLRANLDAIIAVLEENPISREYFPAHKDKFIALAQEALSHKQAHRGSSTHLDRIRNQAGEDALGLGQRGAGR